MGNKIEYEFVNDTPSDPTETCPIKINSGQYKDIIFKYGKINLQEHNDDLSVTMEIDILKSPEGFNKNEQDFTNTVGEIFVSIVESGVEAKQIDPIDLEDDVHQDR